MKLMLPRLFGIVATICATVVIGIATMNFALHDPGGTAATTVQVLANTIDDANAPPITAITPNGQGQSHLVAIDAQLTTADALPATFGNGHVEAVNPPIQVEMNAMVTGDSQNKATVANQVSTTIEATATKGVADVVFLNLTGQSKSAINNIIIANLIGANNVTTLDSNNTTTAQTALNTIVADFVGAELATTITAMDTGLVVTG